MKICISFIFVIVIMAAVSSVYAQTDQKIAGAFTEMMYNGRVFYINNKNIEKYGEQYTYGCIDTLFYLNPGQMAILYPKGTRRDMTEQLKAYYRDNPDNRARPIIEVLMNGCK